MADPTGGRLVAWAEGLAAAHRIGAALSSTSFVPAAFRGKPEEAAAAILFGDEVGMSPTQALNNVHIVQGRPGFYARAMVGLVQSRGHEVWTEEESPARVVVCGRRRGSQHVERAEWTMDRARKAGYTRNAKYDQTPQEMLYARAASQVCRRIAADALGGMSATVEELEMDSPQTTRTVTRSRPSGPAKMSRRVPEPVEPGFDDDPAEQIVDEDDDGDTESAVESGESITEEQRRAIFATFRDAGFTSDARTEEGRAARLDYMSQVLDVQIGSTNDLTRAQASRVLDALRQDATDEGEKP